MLIDRTDPFATAKPDARLIKLLIRARRFNAALIGSEGVPFAELAKQQGVSPSYFTRLVRFSYLAPDITQAILDGRQPRELTADKLLAHLRLPLAWQDQRTCSALPKPDLDSLSPLCRHCGTGIWPGRDIIAGKRRVAGLSQSLPTAPPPVARTPARLSDDHAAGSSGHDIGRRSIHSRLQDAVSASSAPSAFETDNIIAVKRSADWHRSDVKLLRATQSNAGERRGCA